LLQRFLRLKRAMAATSDVTLPEKSALRPWVNFQQVAHPGFRTNIHWNSLSEL
jgi:hypothetical protein